MAEPNPSTRFHAPTTFLASGHQRVASVSLLSVPIRLLTTDAGYETSPSRQMSSSAILQPSGEKQRTLHAEGTSETTARLSGELTEESVALLSLLDASFRGIPLTDVRFAQGGRVETFPIAYVSSFSASGSVGGFVSWAMDLRPTIPPLLGGDPPEETDPPSPVPAWASGAADVVSWTVTHSVSLTPVWRNTADPWPEYYRLGTSEISAQVTTLQPVVHDLITIHVFDVSLIEALLGPQSFPTGNRGQTRTYQTTVVSCRVENEASLLSPAEIPGFFPIGGRPDSRGRSMDPRWRGSVVVGNEKAYRIKPGS
jgi:hypothetical protein